MKIAFFELEGWEEELIKKAFPGHDLFLSKEKLLATNLPKRNDFEIICIFVNSQVNKGVIEFLPNLKFVTTRSTGFDHIDLIECKKRNILVGYVPGYGDNTVAEFTFGLILNLTRKLYEAIDRVKEFNSFALNDLRGMDLKDKAIGIIGTGRIGKEMIKIAHGFSMNILAFDLFPNAETAKSMGFKYLNLEELLKNSDIISIHTPYNEKTRHLLNKKNMKLIKRGAYLINTARGGIVETDALIEALETKVLAGAGLDVLEEEGETKDEMTFLKDKHQHHRKLKAVLENHVLMKMPNVLITPHNAFNTKEALERILDTTIKNITAFIDKKPSNIANND
ncbi:hydroxyacid dehydrogenase [Candidatus Parcubacteria bacterium]|nr:MAG: hydroxyacid dehydrogenase [Candidatus Parcubacteria bacterium]